MKHLLIIILCLGLADLAPAQRITGPTPSGKQSALNMTRNHGDQAYLFYEGFDNVVTPNLPVGWTSFGNDDGGFKTGTAGSSSGQCNENGFWPVPLHGKFALTNDDVCNCDKSNDLLISPWIDVTGQRNIRLGFEAFQNGSGNQLITVEFRKPGGFWQFGASVPASALWEWHEVNVPAAILGGKIQFRFQYNDQGNYASGFAVDNVYLSNSVSGDYSLTSFYTVDGSVDASGYLPALIPISQARQADWRFGGLVTNGTTSDKNASLAINIDGPVAMSDTSPGWYVHGQADTLIRTNVNNTYRPYALGEYTISALLLTDSSDASFEDNTFEQSFEVVDSIYCRSAFESDGTGIWMQGNFDRAGSVFHLYDTSTIAAANVYIHPTTVEGARFRVKIFNFNTLTASIFSSSPVQVEASDLGSFMRIPLDHQLNKGKYLFVVELESGTLLLSSTAKVKSPKGVSFYQRAGNSFQHLAYYPRIELVIPMSDSLCKGHLETILTHESCVGQSDGSAAITPYAIGSPTYQWSHGAGNVATLNNLAADTYQLSVSDTNGCIYERDLIIQAADTLKLKMNITADSCGNETGAIDLRPIGGQAPYVLSLDQSLVPSKTSGLTQGSYDISAMDANGCALDTTVQVPGTDALNVAIGIQRPGCGDSNGILTVSALGTPPFSYAWSNGAIGANLDSLTSGIYVVTVIDSIGCNSMVTAYLNDSNAASISLTNIEHIGCYGSANGELEVQLNGSGIYTPVWSTGDTSLSLTNLTSGTYQLTVSDTSGCLSYRQYSIQETSSPLLLQLRSSGNLCHNNLTAEVEALVAGGKDPIAYQWSNGSDDASIQTLDSGWYHLTVTDDEGCAAMDSTYIHTEPPFFYSVDSLVSDTNGAADPGVFAFLSTFGGTPPYRYAWNNGWNQEDLINADTGQYELTIHDQFGCTLSFSKYLGTDPLFGIPTFTPVDVAPVYPNPITTVESLNIPSGAEGTLVRLYNLKGQFIGSERITNLKIVIPPLAPGMYLLNVHGESGLNEWHRLLVNP